MAQKKRQADPSAWTKVCSIFNAEISPMMVAAILLLSSSTVFAASFAVSQSDFDSGSGLPLPMHELMGRVLGDSTAQAVIDDAALEAQDPSGMLSAKQVSFNSNIGRWDYNLNYSVSSLNNGTATLTIGTYVVQSNITASGTVETGAILKPSMLYRVSLWDVDGSGNKQNLAHINLRTPKASGTAKNPVKPEPCPQLQQASSTPSSAPGFCIRKDDGSTQCLPVCGMFPPGQTPTSTVPYLGHFPPTWATGTPGALPPPHPMGQQTQPPANSSGQPNQ